MLRGTLRLRPCEHIVLLLLTIELVQMSETTDLSAVAAAVVDCSCRPVVARVVHNTRRRSLVTRYHTDSAFAQCQRLGRTLPLLTLSYVYILCDRLSGVCIVP